MRIPRPVVGAQALLMLTREANGPQRRPVGSQFVRHNNDRDKPLLHEQFPQQFQRGDLVAPSVDQYIENLAFAVDGPHIYIRCPPIETTISSRCL